MYSCLCLRTCTAVTVHTVYLCMIDIRMNICIYTILYFAYSFLCTYTGVVFMIERDCI